MLLAVYVRMPVERKHVNTQLMVTHPIERQDPFGRTTENFFLEGQQHEARQWQDTVLPPDDEPEPKRRRGSVDKIPRERSAMVALAILAVALVLGVVTGVSALSKTGKVVDRSAAALKAQLPAGPRAHLPAAAQDSRQASPPAPAQTSAGRPSSGPEQAAPSKPVPATLERPTSAPVLQNPLPAQPSPPPAKPPATQPAPPQKHRPERTGGTSEAKPGRDDKVKPGREPKGSEDFASKKAQRSESGGLGGRVLGRQPHAGDNLVWSPAINALVPVSSIDGLDETTDAKGRQLTRAPVGSPAPRETANRLPASTQSAIAPASTGAPAPERPVSDRGPEEKPGER
jgi:hypothetical protein